MLGTSSPYSFPGLVDRTKSFLRAPYAATTVIRLVAAALLITIVLVLVLVAKLRETQNDVRQLRDELRALQRDRA